MSANVSRCQVCGAQNAELSDVCQRCEATLAASPTMSISPDESAQSGGHITADPASTHNPSTSFNFAPGSMVADRYRVVSLLALILQDLFTPGRGNSSG